MKTGNEIKQLAVCLSYLPSDRLLIEENVKEVAKKIIWRLYNPWSFDFLAILLSSPNCSIV
jgi:hypothetical protein